VHSQGSELVDVGGHQSLLWIIDRTTGASNDHGL
jgi:hypothetical protein